MVVAVTAPPQPSYRHAPSGSVDGCDSLTPTLPSRSGECRSEPLWPPPSQVTLQVTVAETAKASPVLRHCFVDRYGHVRPERGSPPGVGVPGPGTTVVPSSRVQVTVEGVVAVTDSPVRTPSSRGPCHRARPQPCRHVDELVHPWETLRSAARQGQLVHGLAPAPQVAAVVAGPPVVGSHTRPPPVPGNGPRHVNKNHAPVSP